MTEDNGASATQAGLSSDDGAASVSALRASIPSAGDWVVGRTSGYPWRDSYHAFQIDRVTKKLAYGRRVKNGYGYVPRQIPLDDVIVTGNEAEARQLAERIDSAQSEAQRRIKAAQDWARGEIAKLLAQAIEARRAATGTGAVHESAVGNADAPKE
jgi:hypothetical protein